MATSVCSPASYAFMKSWSAEDWLNANISCVYKKGDTHAAENYRPVSLTSVPCKLLEHIICKYIMKHLERHRILTSLNHGLRSDYSCETQLLVTLHDFMKAICSRSLHGTDVNDTGL
jgi:hypothetical protein